MYVSLQAPYLRGFLEDRNLQQWVNAGVLRYVLWDSTPDFRDRPKSFKTVQYNHAILSHWGAHVRLSITDPDEFFVLPYPLEAKSIQVLCKAVPNQNMRDMCNAHWRFYSTRHQSPRENSTWHGIGSLMIQHGESKFWSSFWATGSQGWRRGLLVEVRLWL